MTAEYLMFDFADETTLLDKDNMVRLLIAIAEGDVYQFLKKAIVCDDSPGMIYVPNSPETLANAWNNAIRARAALQRLLDGVRERGQAQILVRLRPEGGAAAVPDRRKGRLCAPTTRCASSSASAN